MPILLPDPAEVAAMDWYARDKTMRRARRLLSEYADMAVPTDGERYRRTVEGKRVSLAAWAAAVREEARVLLHDMGPDPDAEAHRAEVEADA